MFQFKTNQNVVYASVMVILFSAVMFTSIFGGISNFFSGIWNWFVSLFSSTPPPYVPGVSFSMSPTTLTVTSNTTSPTVISLNVQKTDSQDVATQFVIKLVSSSPSNLYPISASSNQQQYNYTTKSLALQGTSDNPQFVVHGVLPTGSSSSKFNITATLYYNNSPISTPQVLSVTIQK